MDRLAREGASFDRAICTSPLCLPSRASLFTSQYPHQINMMRNSDRIDVEPLLTDRLRQSGYHTAYAGKWHLEPDEQPKAFQGRAEALGLAEVHGRSGARGQSSDRPLVRPGRGAGLLRLFGLVRGAGSARRLAGVR